MKGAPMRRDLCVIGEVFAFFHCDGVRFFMKNGAPARETDHRRWAWASETVYSFGTEERDIGLMFSIASTMSGSAQLTAHPSLGLLDDLGGPDGRLRRTA